MKAVGPLKLSLPGDEKAPLLKRKSSRRVVMAAIAFSSGRVTALLKMTEDQRHTPLCRQTGSRRTVPLDWFADE